MTPNLRRGALPLVLALSILAPVVTAATQELELEEPERNGWVLAVLDEDGGEPVRTTRPLGALALRAGESLVATVPPGRRTAELATTLEIPLAGRYRFRVEVTGGRAELSVSSSWGAPVRTAETTDWLDLERGEVGLTLHFTGADDARVRVLWELENTAEAGFPMEPIPARLTRPGDEVAAIDVAVHGRRLLVEKGCTNCHPPADPRDVRPAPKLDDAGRRLSVEWARRWIADPAAVRTGADMPHLVEDPEEALDLAHFVAGLGRGEADDGAVATEPETLARGRQLYHTLGCVACHDALASPAEVFDDPTFDDDVFVLPVLAPFGDLVGKWSPRALSEMLRDPVAVYPDGRMPSLDLTEEEADLVASYLLGRDGGWGARETRARDMAHFVRGGEAYLARGCLACHALEDVPPPASATPLASLGELPETGCGGGPSYSLTADERAAMAAALAREASGVAAHTAPAERARDTLLDLGCLACHAVDGLAGERGGVHPDLDIYFVPLDERTDIGDEGRLPPDLSGVGWKLTTSWFRALLVDGERSRPYMAARMPSYAAEHVAHLPESFGLLFGVHPDTDVEAPEPTDAMVAAGRGMMGRDALGCTACHVVGDLPPTGSPGLAITGFGERLRYEWFRSFLQNPQRYRPGSRMPDFGTGGVSTLGRVYEADMTRQVDAMWAYFGLGDGMPLPDGVSSPGGLELVVGERPVVMRAFLRNTGARGIAVGTPGGVHYALDGKNGNLTEVWQGAFLDLSGSWAGRGGTTLGGQGDALWERDAELDVARGVLELLPAAGAAGTRFRGYRLGADGAPTFLLEVDGFPVELTVEAHATPEPVVRRRYRIAGEARPSEVALVAEPGVRVRAVIDGDAPPESGGGAVESGARHVFLVPAGASEVEVVAEVAP